MGISRHGRMASLQAFADFMGQSSVDSILSDSIGRLPLPPAGTHRRLIGQRTHANFVRGVTEDENVPYVAGDDLGEPVPPPPEERVPTNYADIREVQA